MKYVVGGGVAGITFAYLNPEYKMIDLNPLGQLNSQFVLGPRLIQADEHSTWLLGELEVNEYDLQSAARVEVANIGYEMSGLMRNRMPTPEIFKEKYSFQTRGIESCEDSFLSEGKNYIPHYTFQGHDNSYNLLLDVMFQSIQKSGRHIRAKVIRIDDCNKYIVVTGIDEERERLDYSSLVSTIPIPTYVSLMVMPAVAFTQNKRYLFDKNFYVTLHNKQSRNLAATYAYVYSVDGIYTRKTFNDEYIVYESSLYLKEGEYIDGSMIIKCFKGIPMQIKISNRIDTFRGTQFVGRLAQWDHSVKLSQVIERSRKIGE